MLDVVEQIELQREDEEQPTKLDTLETLSDLRTVEEFMAQKYSGGKIENLLYHRVLKILEEHVGDLDEELSEILHLKFWEDMTDSQIAKELKVTRKDVLNRIEDALESLRVSIFRTLSNEYHLSEGEVLCAVYG